MQIHLSPRHLVLTATIHSHVANKIGHLEASTDRILAAHVVLLHDEKKHPNQEYRVKIHIAVPGPDVYAEAAAENLYTAIDKAAGKVARQLSKQKTKLVSKHKSRRAAEMKKSLA